MIPDLVLALASVAVLLSPVVVDAGRQLELRRILNKEEEYGEQERPS